MLRKNNQAYYFVEYVVVLSLLAAVLVGMRIFFTRSVQARFRQSADVFGQGEQYEKGLTQITLADGLTLEPPDDPGGFPPDSCEFIRAKVESLESQAQDLRRRADENEERAAELEEQAQLLREQGFIKEAKKLEKQAKKLRERAKDMRKEAEDKEKDAQKLRDEHPDCFSS